MCYIENFGAMYPMPSAPAPIINIRFNAAKLPVSFSFAVFGDLDKAPHRRLPKAQTQARVLVALIMRKNTSRRRRWSSRLHMSLRARQRKTRTTRLGFSVWATWSPLAEQYQRRGWIVLKVHSESKRDDDVEAASSIIPFNHQPSNDIESENSRN
ncbi:uncharacterized protein PpBr36_11105 [Pyricularia pennisetigena]|uniref:uncharacterized protein n=1 Tax=Pyricularia pennisetigena TaxID=1578925 RepID=UPI001153F6A0|nr:uncharacterized protein PpBr36_11105 [Pyricularia pennisetigena]TLS20654.1 hypothetical protein PpBr36_11105 [Pyricularia pennisetigena]